MVAIEDLQWIRMSKHRLGVLSVLEDMMKSPKGISIELNLNLSNVSKTLSQMSSKGYIVNKTPSLWKHKLFAITKKGKEALEEIKVLFRR